MAKKKVKKSTKKQQGLNKKKKQIIAAVVLLLLMVGGGIAYKVMNQPSGELIGGNFLPEGKDAKQMSKEELAKAAQKAVDESEFTLSILPEAEFPNGKSEGSIYIKNEAHNAFPISVEVVENETGDVIYESGGIEPGYEITSGTLKKNLAKGKYNCTAKVSIYDPKTKELKGETAAEMEVDVKG